MKMKEKIIDYIKGHRGTSFVEIERVFEANNFDYKGNLAILSEEQENVLYWYGWNAKAYSVLEEIFADESICKAQTMPLTYAIDGKVPTLPLAKNYSKRKNMAWLPITFSFLEEVN